MYGIPHLLLVVDAYKAATGLEDKTVSSRVFADSKKLGSLRDGTDITVGRFNAALVWFSQNWPDGAAWPSNVARPSGERIEAAE